jgi:hypothetical protein
MKILFTRCAPTALVTFACVTFVLSFAARGQ